MDEESVGLFGVLLIATAVVLAHPFQVNASLPTLPEVHWHDLVVAACGEDPSQDCNSQIVEP